MMVAQHQNGHTKQQRHCLYRPRTLLPANWIIVAMLSQNVLSQHHGDANGLSEHGQYCLTNGLVITKRVMTTIMESEGDHLVNIEVFPSFRALSQMLNDF